VVSNNEKLFHPPELVGLLEAEAAHGSPIRRRARTVPSKDRSTGVYTFGHNRSAEIVLVLMRPGGILLHSKRFYPSGVYRLPTGGVHDGEPVLHAVQRELEEETGLRMEPSRFLFHLRYPGPPGSPQKAFHSLGFVFPLSEGPLVPLDQSEQIESWKVVAWEEIPALIESLENLEDGWSGWGQFRALAHQLTLECRGAHPEWFVGN
jgi:NAD+ diphosphatase